MVLIFDIGNTHVHLGLANENRVTRQANIPQLAWSSRTAEVAVRRFVGRHRITGAVVCSVVPKLTPRVCRLVQRSFNTDCLELNPQTLRGVGVDYPRPETIGPDRLANAVAANFHYGAPSVVVDFGTAVTFDVIDGRGNYIGGIIAPGLAAMTDYLHEKTALLPRIKIRDVSAVIGKNTEEAMLIGAVHGYRGLIRELLRQLKERLQAGTLPVIATGGYAQLIAGNLPEITAVDPMLTLEGLRLVWRAHFARAQTAIGMREGGRNAG